MDIHYNVIYRKDFVSSRNYRRDVLRHPYVICFRDFSLIFYSQECFNLAKNAISFLESLEPVFREANDE